MYFSKIPENESAENYNELKIGNKIFYTLKSEKKSIKSNLKRRYSDQFKDPLFITKDTFRKLNMLKQFKRKYKDIDLIIEKYIDCIETCINILNSEFSIEPKTIFQALDLKQFKLNPSDFGVEINEEKCEDEEELD